MICVSSSSSSSSSTSSNAALACSTGGGVGRGAFQARVRPLGQHRGASSASSMAVRTNGNLWRVPHAGALDAQPSKNSHTKTTGNRQAEQTHRQKQQQRRQLLHEINNRSQFGFTVLFSKPLWRFKWSAWKVRKLVILAARGLARSPAPTSCPLPAPFLIQVAPSKRSAACGSGTGRRSSSSFARLSTARRSGTGCRVHIFRPT